MVYVDRSVVFVVSFAYVLSAFLKFWPIASLLIAVPPSFSKYKSPTAIIVRRNTSTTSPSARITLGVSVNSAWWKIAVPRSLKPTGRVSSSRKVTWRRRSSATEESVERVEVRICARTRVVGGGNCSVGSRVCGGLLCWCLEWRRWC
jgi:hypothetical protein